MNSDKRANIEVSETDVETLLMALQVAENETFGIDRHNIVQLYDNVLKQACGAIVISDCR